MVLSMYDYLIVGAGISGAIFAHEMAKAGLSCLVIDSRNHIGGNCYSHNVNGIDVHEYGAHIVRTSDYKIWSYLNSITKFIPFKNEPKAYYDNKIYSLPFNMNLFREIYDVNTPRQAKEAIEKDIIRIENPKNVEEKAISSVGSKIYNMFIKDYTEKQWGKSCAELPPETIGDLKLRLTFDNDYYDDIYSGVPEDGYCTLFKALLKDCDVILNEKYQLNSSINKLAKKVIFTGMLDELFNYENGHLEYRSLEFKKSILPVNNFQGVAVVNYTGKEPFTRKIEFKHFNKFNKGFNLDKTVVYTEYPIDYKEGMIPYYPMNDCKNKKLHIAYKNKAIKHCIVPLGRLALYKYDSIDTAVTDALILSNYEQYMAKRV